MDTITIQISEKDIASGRPLSKNEHVKFNSFGGGSGIMNNE